MYSDLFVDIVRKSTYFSLDSAMMLGFSSLAICCSFVITFAAVTKRTELTALSTAIGGSNTISFPLSRTPTGDAYLINVTFPDIFSTTVPLQLELSSPQSWVNTPTTYCWNPGNLPNLFQGSCGVTGPESSCSGYPQPVSFYVNSDGESMWGKHCTAVVALGPVDVDDQDLMYADQNEIQPDNASAGVLGLAYPEMFDTSPARTLSPARPTSSISSTPSVAPSTSENRLSLLANLFHQHDSSTDLTILPVMALAISRDTSGVNNAGTLSLGVQIVSNITSVNTSVATIPISLSNFSGMLGVVYDDSSAQYNIPVSIVLAGNISYPIPAPNSSSIALSTFNMYLSTSRTGITLPPDIAASVNAQYDPPGILGRDNATYYVACNATAPNLELVIANQTFAINPIDMKRHASQSLCVSPITASFTGRYLLGDLFLRNVHLVFDFRSLELTIMSRMFYES